MCLCGRCLNSTKFHPTKSSCLGAGPAKFSTSKSGLYDVASNICSKKGGDTCEDIAISVGRCQAYRTNCCQDLQTKCKLRRGSSIPLVQKRTPNLCFTDGIQIDASITGRFPKPGLARASSQIIGNPEVWLHSLDLCVAILKARSMTNRTLIQCFFRLRSGWDTIYPSDFGTSCP